MKMVISEWDSAFKLLISLTVGDHILRQLLQSLFAAQLTAGSPGGPAKY